MGGAPAGAGGAGGIQVVQVEGLLDAPNVSMVRDTIETANDDGRTLLVIQLDSPGAIADVTPLVRTIDRSRVPVAAWIGPSGAEAEGGAALLAESAHALFVSQGSSIGPAHPLRLDEPDAVSVRGASRRLAAPAAARGRDPAATEELATRRIPADAAAGRGVVDGTRPTVGETIVQLDGETVATAGGDVELSTARVIGEGRDRRRQPNQEVVFASLDLGGQVQHLLISPSVAYFLLAIGLALIAFEFFAASVGFAAGVGAVCVIGACYGFSHLPVRWWAAALLVLATFGFAVDAQAGRTGFWTAVGAAALVAGSVTLYGGSSDLRPSWWVWAVVVVTVLGFSVLAVPAFIRARFSTPTVGREGMLGELGTAEVAVDPDGVVVVRDARWRARTNRATPVPQGATIRVIAVEGLVLEVEPESGGARDYRDRARRRKRAPE